MYNDFTYDLFMEDAKLYHETPYKGVHVPTDNYRRYFMVWLKDKARDFKADWNKTHAHLYDRYDGYIGDAFARELRNGFDWFSDFYKDTYGQRPHLAIWYYVQAVGLPMSEDTARKFCASPVENAIWEAKEARERWSD